jgi:uncharacterized protein YjbI with pentapeptide repeats
MHDDAGKEIDSETSEGGPDTKEVEALASALNHSAERVQTLWFSFLTFMIYLAIAAGTTTHRMLFLESPLNLPVLNIALLLLGFYILTPIIFVVFHFYMLLNLVLLARTAKSFEDSLAHAFPEDGEARENFRMRIENTLFVQLLVGGRLEREGLNAKLLSLMALITLMLAPVALLLMIQIKFLPYHSEWITWWHRGLLTIDLLLVWTLWRAYRSGWGVITWPQKSWRLVRGGALSAVALLYALLWLTFPGETQHMFLTRDWSRDVLGFSNTLYLSGENLVDDPRSAHIIQLSESSPDARWEPTLNLWKRDLTNADLTNADIRHAKLVDAILNGAKLDWAWAKGAHLDGAQLQGASLDGAQLQGARLDHAKLRGARLDHAKLRGARLDHAQLRGARLDFAQLQGAWLDFAQLRGAWLDFAQLRGASLGGAQLQGAWLGGAQLQGAWLGGAQLRGAWLGGAQLQGAWLDFAQLRGASLDGAQLQGAWLDHAELQGASLHDAQLQGASLDGAHLQGAWLAHVFVWRADARYAVWNDTNVTAPETGLIDEQKKEWSVDSFERLKQMIAEEVSEGDMRRDALQRIEQRLDPTKALEGENDMAKVWKAHARSSPAREVYEKRLAELWHETGCAAEGAPYVLREFLHRLAPTGAEAVPINLPRFGAQSPQVPELAKAFLDEEHCPAARGLTDAEKAKLKAIRDRSPSATPKQ